MSLDHKKQLDRVVLAMRLVEDDCVRDAIALDTTPFTARAVATAFGRLLAMMKACAAGIGVIAAAQAALMEEADQ